MEQENNISFDFTLVEPPDKDIHRFLWLGVHNEGVQAWDNSLTGLDFKDALIRDIVKNPYGLTIYYDFREMFDEKYPELDIFNSKAIFITLEQVNNIVDQMIEYIKCSEIDGDSSEQIIVFDISNTTDNITMLYPEYEKHIGQTVGKANTFVS